MTTLPRTITPASLEEEGRRPGTAQAAAGVAGPKLVDGVRVAGASACGLWALVARGDRV